MVVVRLLGPLEVVDDAGNLHLVGSALSSKSPWGQGRRSAVRRPSLTVPAAPPPRKGVATFRLGVLERWHGRCPGFESRHAHRDKLTTPGDAIAGELDT